MTTRTFRYSINDAGYTVRAANPAAAVAADLRAAGYATARAKGDSVVVIDPRAADVLDGIALVHGGPGVSPHCVTMQIRR